MLIFTTKNFNNFFKNILKFIVKINISPQISVDMYKKVNSMKLLIKLKKS